MTPPSMKASRETAIVLPQINSDEIDECHAQIARQASKIHSLKIASEELRVKLKEANSNCDQV